MRNDFIQEKVRQSLTKEIPGDTLEPSKIILSILALNSPLKQSLTNMKNLKDKFLMEKIETVPISSSVVARKKVELKPNEKIA